MVQIDVSPYTEYSRHDWKSFGQPLIPVPWYKSNLIAFGPTRLVEKASTSYESTRWIHTGLITVLVGR
jgi:hypothetical protein